MLQAVADDLRLERFDLLGISTAAALSVAFAARYPRRVGRLVLCGGYADGHQVATAEVRAAMIAMVRANCGLGSDLLADVFLPDGWGADPSDEWDSRRNLRDESPIRQAVAGTRQDSDTLIATTSTGTSPARRRPGRVAPGRAG